MRLLKHLFLIMILLFSLTAKSQLSIDTTSHFVFDQVTNSSTDMSQYPALESMVEGNYEWFNHVDENYSESDTAKPFFKIDTLSAAKFTRIKKHYNYEVNRDTTKLNWTDTSFSISGANWSKTFKADSSDYSFFEYYLGFHKTLNLYLISSIDGENEVGTLKLVDKFSGKEFYMESPFDEPCVSIFTSPKISSLITFANTWYENDHAFISLIRIVKNKRSYKLSIIKDLYLDNLNILDVAWIDEHSFAISIVNKPNTSNGDINTHPDCFLRISF